LAGLPSEITTLGALCSGESLTRPDLLAREPGPEFALECRLPTAQGRLPGRELLPAEESIHGGLLRGRGPRPEPSLLLSAEGQVLHELSLPSLSLLLGQREPCLLLLLAVLLAHELHLELLRAE
jgi:hypothetical protein